jgi:hypothetical protein
MTRIIFERVDGNQPEGCADFDIFQVAKEGMDPAAKSGVFMKKTHVPDETCRFW